MTLGPPLISVIIPVFNGENYLADAVRSVLRQSYPNIEIIVVDDGSTDGTSTVASSFRERVRYAFQDNQGVSSARNTGIGLAQGEFVAFLDADDVWLPNKLERQMQAITDGPSWGAVGCGMLLTDADLNVTGERVPTGTGFKDLLLLRGNCGLNCSTAVVRKAVLRDVGVFDVRLSTSADWDLITRISRRHRVTAVPEALVYYRQHGGNMHRSIRRTETDMRLVLDKACSAPLPRGTAGLRRRAYSNLYRMLAGSYWHANSPLRAIHCALRSLAWHPGNLPYMLRFPLRQHLSRP